MVNGCGGALEPTRVLSETRTIARQPAAYGDRAAECGIQAEHQLAAVDLQPVRKDKHSNKVVLSELAT